jgi:hypothetical protein
MRRLCKRLSNRSVVAPYQLVLVLMGNHKRVLVKVEGETPSPMAKTQKMVRELVVAMAKKAMKTLKRVNRGTLVNILLTQMGQKKQTNRHLLKALQIVTNQLLSEKFGMPKMRI